MTPAPHARPAIAFSHRISPPDRFGAARRWSIGALVTVSWISGAIFAAYILVFFGGAIAGGIGERWNRALPGLYDPGAPLATFAIGAHFLTGGALLLLGPIQLIGRLRRAVPALHRWLGRLYVVSAGIAGLGGLGFILGQGTIGGPLMDLGFGLYGGLMVLSAGFAYAHARAGRIEAHRAWAIRLFALTIGSWLYRMEYGLWFLMFGSVGRGPEFSGWFDAIMVFFFYIPNLVVAEIVIRTGAAPRSPRTTLATIALLLVATLLVTAMTATFTARAWGPRILDTIA